MTLLSATIVSNHGGFQLGSAPASLRVPFIVDAVGDRTEVPLYSGTRRGQHVVMPRR
jgi:isopentenyl diphosphate isomerase/L-lactate dehydrogenase-like FMN-dependent dehydrogenase